jgi:hypothetical protein
VGAKMGYAIVGEQRHASRLSYRSFRRRMRFRPTVSGRQKIDKGSKEGLAMHRCALLGSALRSHSRLANLAARPIHGDAERRHKKP